SMGRLLRPFLRRSVTDDEACFCRKPTAAAAPCLHGRHPPVGTTRLRTSNPTKFGAGSLTDPLVAARAVPGASLFTTLNPLLNGLLDAVAYEGTLVGGADSATRMLVDLMTFPDGQIPFLFLDLARNSKQQRENKKWAKESPELPQF
ncbi:hypothetical protein ANCDUO_24386, partial [Ancylostoma duodenale]